jgi:hypothetical protein
MEVSCTCVLMFQLTVWQLINDRKFVHRQKLSTRSAYVSLQRYAVRFGLVPSFSTEKKERKKVAGGKRPRPASRMDLHFALTYTHAAGAFRKGSSRSRTHPRVYTSSSSAATWAGPGPKLTEQETFAATTDELATWFVLLSPIHRCFRPQTRQLKRCKLLHAP